jgi:hypothetical protein
MAIKRGILTFPPLSLMGLLTATSPSSTWEIPIPQAEKLGLARNRSPAKEWSMLNTRRAQF